MLSLLAYAVLCGGAVASWLVRSTPDRGGRSNTLNRFMLRKPELSAGPMGFNYLLILYLVIRVYYSPFYEVNTLNMI